MTQKTRTDLNTEATTNLPDNSVRAISEADVRNLQVNQNDSAFILLTDVVESVKATSTDTGKVLAPDGAGGVNFVTCPSGGLATKSGVVLPAGFPAGSPRKATVTFGAAFSDANYSPVVTGEDSRSWTIESIAAGSFVINSNSGSAVSGNTYWTAIKHGET